MLPKFLLILLLSSNSFGQLLITGRVVDQDKTPLPGVNIVARGVSVGTISDATGAFRFTISQDTVFLQIIFIGYQGQTLKFTESTDVEIVLQEQDLLLGNPKNGRWKLVRGEKPLHKIKGSTGTTEVYAETTIQLNSVESRSRMVNWEINQFTVSAPFDSLRKYIDRSNFYAGDLMKFLDSQKGTETLSLPENVAKQSKRLLNEFAVNMISSDSMVITDKNGKQTKELLVKDVFWHGKNCTLCCWGGIEFVIQGKNKTETILFAITSVIC